MWNTTDRSLPDWIQTSYDVLAPHFEDQPDGIPRSDAHEILLNEAKPVETPSDAEYALDRLLDRGWLYAVNDTLHKTE